MMMPIKPAIFPPFCICASAFWISATVVLLVTFGIGMWWLGEQATLSVGAGFDVEVVVGFFDELELDAADDDFEPEDEGPGMLVLPPLAMSALLAARS